MSGHSDTPSPGPARQKPPQNPKKNGASVARELRLKAALKANMAKRKAQARAKLAVGSDGAADIEQE